MLGGWAYAPIIEVETHRGARSDRRAGANRNRSHDRLRAPVLVARRRGPAVWLADSLDGLHPAALFVVVMLAGLVTIAALSIGLGFLITRVVEHAWGIGAADERVNVWLAAHRTSSRTDASLIGSILAGGVVLPIVAGVDRAHLCRAAQVADRGLRRVRACGRVGHLPRNDARGPRAPSTGRQAREPAGQRELPVGSHRGVCGCLLRPRAAADVPVHEHDLPGCRMDDRRRVGDVRRHIAHVSRDAPPAWTLREALPSGWLP